MILGGVEQKVRNGVLLIFWFGKATGIFGTGKGGVGA